MGPKKNVKMDLGSFLADDSIGGGSWADEEVDMTSIGVPTNSTAAVPERSFGRGNDFGREGGFGGREGGFGGFNEDRPERKEFPIPDEPPYKARVGNLPWDINEETVKSFFERRMQMVDVVTEVNLPQDPSGRLKGFGFVTFTERKVLEQALNLTLADLNGRKVFVSVAAPPRQDVFDLDWRSARSGPLGGPSGSRGPRRDREDEPELDWGAARSEQTSLPPRERSFRGPRRERTDEPDLDWGSARSEETGLPPRERSFRGPRRERPEEPALDWGSARSEETTLPPRERSFRGPRKERTNEPELDWGSARSEETTLPPREKSFRKPRKQESQLDWGNVRSEAPKSNRSNSRRNNNKPEEPKEQEQGPQKSSYDVLTIEGESDEESSKVAETKKEEPKTTKSLEQATANLSISKEQTDEDGWEVVRK